MILVPTSTGCWVAPSALARAACPCWTTALVHQHPDSTCWVFWLGDSARLIAVVAVLPTHTGAVRGASRSMQRMWQLPIQHTSSSQWQLNSNHFQAQQMAWEQDWGSMSTGPSTPLGNPGGHRPWTFAHAGLHADCQQTQQRLGHVPQSLLLL